MIEYVHPNLLPELTLEVAKPNREVIGRLKDAYNRSQSIKLGQINEINLTIPYMIQRDHTSKKNPMVDKLLSQYHVKATFGDQIEWFVVTNKNKTSSDDGKSTLDVQLKSLGYQLKNKKIKTWAGIFINGEFRKESLNAQQVLDDLLSQSTWSIEYIDSEFLTKYRAFDFSSTNVLDAIFNVAETFGAIIKWDTVNKSISLIKQENAGINKGFRISERKYLKTIGKEEKSDEVVTRLRVYGKDGLSIEEVNPTGLDYLEDYSYFMQGFERNSNKTTISSSLYMSDSLCHALLDYQDVIAENDGQFNTYLTQKETLYVDLGTKQGEMSALEIELAQVLDSIDIKQTTQLDASVELAQKATLETQMNNKQSEIDSINTQIDSIDNQILTLKNTLSVESNLTTEQIIELDDYILEEEWEDQNYTDAQELFDDAQKVFDDLKKPKEIITTNIINIFKILEGKQEWKKVVIGDKFYIDYERFGIDVEAQLIELDINHDSTDITVTIANTKDIERDEDKLAKILYGSISTANTVDMSKYKWDQVNNVKTEVSEIINNAWDSAKNAVMSGVNNSVEINRRGITITSTDDLNKMIRMTNGVIGLTQDGGNTFKTAITGSHIATEVLMGKITITENLYVENEAGKYSINQDGMVINNGSFKMVDDGTSNGISITPESGFISSSPNTKALFNSTEGFKFQVKEGTLWKDKFYYDVVNSRLVLNGEMNASEIKINGQSVLTVDNKISGQYLDAKGISVKNSSNVTTFSVDSNGNAMFAGSLSAADGTFIGELIGASIKSGSTIDVATDATVGNNLYLGDYSTYGITRKLYFNDQAYISGGNGFVGANINIECNELHMNADRTYVSPNDILSDVSEHGFCGVGGWGDAGLAGTACMTGVNFRVKKSYVPSSVTFTDVAYNRTPYATNINVDGFLLYVLSQNAANIVYWRGYYDA